MISKGDSVLRVLNCRYVSLDMTWQVSCLVVPILGGHVYFICHTLCCLFFTLGETEIDYKPKPTGANCFISNLLLHKQRSIRKTCKRQKRGRKKDIEKRKCKIILTNPFFHAEWTRKHGICSHQWKLFQLIVTGKLPHNVVIFFQIRLEHMTKKFGIIIVQGWSLSLSMLV